MAKLKESDASATSSSAAADNPFAGLSGAEGEEMAKLLAALGGSGDLSGLEGAMDNPELTKMLEGMMDELMSREILYEPLKELRDKYPAYLAGAESRDISADDRKRYEQQSAYITQIVAVFEDPQYDAKDAQMAARVQELMNQMQDCGSPPKEIVGDMPAELESLPGFGGAGGNEECTIM
jgi:peroxin-19